MKRTARLTNLLITAALAGTALWAVPALAGEQTAEQTADQAADQTTDQAQELATEQAASQTDQAAEQAQEQMTGEISQGMFAWLTVEAYNSACSINGGTENLWENKIEGMDTEEWILNQAKESAREYLAVEEKFDESGLSLRSAEEELIEETLERYWNELGYGRYYEDYGIGQEDFRDVLTHSAKIDILYSEEQSALEDSITQEQLTEYISEHLTLLEYISVPYAEDADTEDSLSETPSDAQEPQGEDSGADSGAEASQAEVSDSDGAAEDSLDEDSSAGTTANDMDALYASYRERLEGGEDLSDLVEEIGSDETLMAQGVGSSWQYDLPEVLFWNDSSQLSEEFREAMAEAEPDTIQYFDDSAQSYQLIFMTKEFTPDWEGLDFYRDAITEVMTQETFLNKMSAWGREMELANEEDLPTAKDVWGMWNEE